LDKDLPPEAPAYIRHAASIIEYANMDEEERTVLGLLERAEADRLAREEQVREEAAEETQKLERSISFNLMASFGITPETIAENFSITVAEVMEYLKYNEYDDDIDDDDEIEE
jgi:hypothetical protein